MNMYESGYTSRKLRNSWFKISFFEPHHCPYRSLNMYIYFFLGPREHDIRRSHPFVGTLMMIIIITDLREQVFFLPPSLLNKRICTQTIKIKKQDYNHCSRVKFLIRSIVRIIRTKKNVCICTWKCDIYICYRVTIPRNF